MMLSSKVLSGLYLDPWQPSTFLQNVPFHMPLNFPFLTLTFEFLKKMMMEEQNNVTLLHVVRPHCLNYNKWKSQKVS